MVTLAVAALLSGQVQGVGQIKTQLAHPIVNLLPVVFQQHDDAKKWAGTFKTNITQMAMTSGGEIGAPDSPFTASWLSDGKLREAITGAALSGPGPTFSIADLEKLRVQLEMKNLAQITFNGFKVTEHAEFGKKTQRFLTAFAQVSSTPAIRTTKNEPSQITAWTTLHFAATEKDYEGVSASLALKVCNRLRTLAKATGK